MSSSEYLSPDILERNFVKCFMPIHITQWVLGWSRVDVRANFAMPTTLAQKIYSLLLAALVGVSCVGLSTSYYERYYAVHRTVFLTCSIAIFLNYFTYLCKLFHIRLVGLSDSLRLYVLLQKIDRILNLTNNERVFRQQYYVNMAVLGMSVLHIPGGVLHVYMDLHGNLTVFFATVIQAASYLEVMFIGSLLHYLTVRLRFLNEAIKDQTSVKVEKLALVNTWFECDLPPRTTGFNSKLALTLKLILATFKVINKIYNFEILVLAACTVLWPLLIIEALVMGYGTKVISWTTCTGIVIWSVFYNFQVIFLAVTCDRFKTYIKQTKRLCIEVLFECYEEPLMKLVKDMLTIIEREAPEFSVYGIFTLDRHLPLHLLTLTTSYVIILVQFTLL